MVYLDVAINRNVAEVKSILVCAGGHSHSAAKRFVRVNRELCHIDGAEAAGMSANGRENLFGSGGPELSTPRRARQFCFVELVITAQEHEGDLILHEINEGFDLILRGDFV